MRNIHLFKWLSLVLFVFILGTTVYPYLYGRSLTQTGYTYLGTIHYPVDYFYYLSQITQGERNHLFVDYIQGSENLPPTLVGWMYTFFGSVTHFFHIPPIPSYQIFLLVSTGLFFLLAFCILQYIFPKNEAKQFIGLLFLFFSNELPRFIRDGAGWKIFHEKIWYNFGEPFVRIDPVPSHMMILASILLIFIAVFLYWRSTTKNQFLFLFLLILPAIILVTANPIQLIPVIGSLGFSFLFHQIQQISKTRRIHLQQVIVDAAPFIVILAVTVPLFIIMNRTVQTVPYSLGRVFEASGNVWMKLNFISFIQLYGIVAVLGILSFPIFLRSKNMLRQFLSLYAIIGFSIYFSPIPERIGVQAIRFISAVTILAFASSAVDGIYFVASFSKRFNRSIIAGTTLLITFLLLLPFPQEMHIKTDVNIFDWYYYLPTTVYGAIVKAKSITPVNQVMLVFWPLNTIVPAITGQKTYQVHELTTINFNEKGVILDKLINNQMTEEEMKAFFKTNNIKTILLNNSSPFTPPSFITSVFKTSTMTVYQVE